MAIKSDRWIRQMAQEHDMISPFEAGQVKESGGQRLISYGTSSYGYDVRCSSDFKVFTNIHSATVDPKAFDDRSFVDIKSDVCIIPPNSFALARTVEYFKIPRSVLTICLGKSTYARCGIIVNVTPLEPEWEGHGAVAVGANPSNFQRSETANGCVHVLLAQNLKPVGFQFSAVGDLVSEWGPGLSPLVGRQQFIAHL